ncbi:hypothetical protein OFB65_26700, partial [Escherichia coli]|nr:hypothetical protein [Escherichia coli]
RRYNKVGPLKAGNKDNYYNYYSITSSIGVSYSIKNQNSIQKYPRKEKYTYLATSTQLNLP